MTALAQEHFELARRCQTTVPWGVDEQLKFGNSNEIVYHNESSDRVYIEPVRGEERDPAIGAFLDIIEADITSHPERLRALKGALHDRCKALVGDVHVDLDGRLYRLTRSADGEVRSSPGM